MNYEALHFSYDIARPDRLNVYDETTITIDGVDLSVAIIGSSHCVRGPSIGFEEIVSCDERSVGDCDTIRIGDRTTTTVERDDAAAACTTTISVGSIDRFPDDRTFDLSHAFAERAVTAIEAGDRGYETWHTYPEYAAAVYTETTFVRLGRECQSIRDRSAEDLASL